MGNHVFRLDDASVFSRACKSIIARELKDVMPAVDGGPLEGANAHLKETFPREELALELHVETLKSLIRHIADHVTFIRAEKGVALYSLVANDDGSLTFSAEIRFPNPASAKALATMVRRFDS